MRKNVYNIPTEKKEACQNPRFSFEAKEQYRQKDYQSQTPQGPQAPRALMPHFSLRVLPGDEVKIAVPVSKKIAKKAVTRNLIRRRVRPILRELVSNLKPATYMIIAKAGAEKIKGKELKEELVRLIRSIRN